MESLADRLLLVPLLNNSTWKILWKLNVSAKVKIYCWRILHGVLPLKDILFRRHIGTDGVCPSCNTAEEDVRHMLFFCQDAEQIWKSLGMESMIHDASWQGRSGSEILGALLSSNQSDVPGFELIQSRELIVVSAWYIWWIRRHKSHGEKIPPIPNCVTSIRAITANTEKAKSVSSSMQIQKWVRPRCHFMKVNVDAAFDAGEEAGAIAAVVRDSQGNFVVASARFTPHVGSV
jgi:hypothetical protein